MLIALKREIGITHKNLNLLATNILWGVTLKTLKKSLKQ